MYLPLGEDLWLRGYGKTIGDGMIVVFADPKDALSGLAEALRG